MTDKATKRVLVTGGSGHLGQYVIRDLLAHDYEVVNIDRRPPPEASAPYRETNVGDVGQVAGAMVGCGAVIHLGAIPSPGHHADEFVFANNTGATFAVLQAAALLGVRKAVIASSVSAIGMAYAKHPFAPRYAPVDEEHPLLPQDPYGLSKEVDERTGEMFHRQTGMQVLAHRFHWVSPPGVAAAAAEAVHTDPTKFCNNLWGYVDVRDAATACRLGIEADGLGFEAFNIMAADTLAPDPTEEMIRRHTPSVELRGSIPGYGTAFPVEKARQLLGYKPQFSWRE